MMKSEDPAITQSSYETWETYRMDNGLVELHTVPDTGGRAIQFFLGEKAAPFAPTLYAGVVREGCYLAQDGILQRSLSTKT